MNKEKKKMKKMKKRTIYIFLGFLILIIWIITARENAIYVYFNFRHLGVDVVKVGYYHFLDDRVSAEINIEKDNKIYNVVFRRIYKESFFNESSVVIESINGYGLLRCVCTPPEVRIRVYNEDNKPVGSTVLSNLMGFSSNSILNEFFDIEESSISWIISNIDKIEEKFMKIPTDYYSYFKSSTGVEMYFKRQKVDDDYFINFYRYMSSDKALNDTVFVFENSDCNKYRL